ncbi:hypothetical protein [Colwellia sp. 12G3]|jgi:hypothetical protein|uniref:hypothetical protein n=1 Tax=Colwellia sp. 12G3 TaxID=2058299 RepID=UPI000C32F167|nr:hypothetical protein [Colwellia sp. 12G3]PKI16310.1 hypothetical protein CXF71_09935 [Colwellia sp. 12G3]
MNNDIKGICLFLGLIGLGYVALLILVALLTGAKIIKSIMFISIFSTFLISLGLTPQVKNRLFNYLKTLKVKQFA